MKKSLIISVLLILSFIIITFSSGVGGGSSSDPLVTKSQANKIINTAIDEKLSKSLESIEPSLENIVAISISDKVSTKSKVSYVLNDSLKINTGDKITLRSGNIKINGTGSLIDITNGLEQKSPTSLNYNTTYVVAENSSFTVNITSLTAKLSSTGSFSNPYNIKYQKYAEALDYLGLFRGTEYSYELDRPATRTEAIVMLIRILGEENQALAYKGSHPFTDVASWADSYVAYAYNEGYTKGISDKLFGANSIIKDYEYYTFILRALNYQDSVDFAWDHADTKALELGIVPKDVIDLNIFYRDHIALSSFNALDVCLKDSEQTLVKFLAQKGIVNLEDYSYSLSLTK